MSLDKRINTEQLNIKDFNFQEWNNESFDPERDISAEQWDDLLQVMEENKEFKPDDSARIASKIKLLNPAIAINFDPEWEERTMAVVRESRMLEHWDQFFDTLAALKILKPINYEFNFTAKEVNSIDKFLKSDAPFYSMQVFADMKITGLQLNDYIFLPNLDAGPDVIFKEDFDALKARPGSSVSDIFKYGACIRTIDPWFKPELGPEFVQAMKKHLKKNKTHPSELVGDAFNLLIATAPAIEITENGLEITRPAAFEAETKSTLPKIKNF